MAISSNGKQQSNGAGGLALVTHRLPYDAQSAVGNAARRRAAGGLVAALEPLWATGRATWIGGSYQGGEDAQLSRIVPIRIPDNEGRRFHDGFSNSVLWPLFHYFTESIRFDPRDFDAYRSVNERFADAVASAMRPSDSIWIHDYHLMLLPALIRSRMPEARIGFFLHTPFPSSEVFRILPMAQELLEGLGGADLIGFHTFDYARHFVSSWRRIAGGSYHDGAVTLGKRATRVGVFPLGVDAEQLRDRAELPDVTRRVKRRQQQFSGRKVILSVDRLDYTKGIVLRLKAYRELLEKNPQWASNAVFLMVAVPTRSAIARYQAVKKEVEQLVGEINGAFSSEGRAPIHYLYRSVTPEELSALYRLADVLVVTPVRDGMNLVAKEYIASRPDDSGVLVLSRFAGAAAELGEACIVNPWDIRGTARIMVDALQMEATVQGKRMAAMRKRIKKRNLSAWSQSFVQALEAAPAASMRGEKPKPKLLGLEFQRAQHALVLLDYDGTLTPFAETPDQAAPDDDLLSLLRRLSARGHTDVVIVSGRESTSLERWFGELDIHLVAEHGLFLRRRGSSQWSGIAPDSDVSWIPFVREVMVAYATQTPGSWIEEKKASLAWHYRQAEFENARIDARELGHHLAEMFNDYPLQVLHGNCVVEVRPHGIHKGLAYKVLTEQLGNCDFVFAAGDDRTDEDLFRSVPSHAWTVKVGEGPSAAKIRCKTPADLRATIATMITESDFVTAPRTTLEAEARSEAHKLSFGKAP